MNSEETRRALEHHAGNSACIVWDDGASEVLTIVSVDDEGFVYELITPDQTQYYWSRFDEVESVK